MKGKNKEHIRKCIKFQTNSIQQYFRRANRFKISSGSTDKLFFRPIDYRIDSFLQSMVSTVRHKFS